MRKGVDGLAAIVNLSIACDFSGESMFIFCNNSRNRVKIIERDGDGFWLYQKRLERGTFPWPAEGRVKRMVITKDARYGRLGAEIRRCGCRAHVRRKIHEGIQAVLQEQPACASQKGLEYCDRLFSLERDYTKLTLEERRVKRLEQSKAITDALLAWASNTP